MSQDAFADSHFQSLVIENFTVFEHAEFEFSPGVNIFIGENGCGKTHLLKTIYLQLETALHVLMNSSLIKDNRVDNIAYRSFPDRIVDFFQNESYSDIRRSSSGGTKCSGMLFNRETETTFDEDVAIYRAPNPDSKVENRLTLIPAMDVTAHTKGFLSTFAVYKIDFDRTFYDIVLRLLGPEKRDLSEQNITLIQGLQELIGGKLTLEGERFYVTQGEKKFAMPMIAEGHRKIATLIRLIQTGWLEPGSVLIWDEPEVNLNPKLMGELVAALLILAESGVQIFLATHSYVILKEFDLQSQEKNVPIKYFALEPTSTGTKVHPSDTLDDLEPNAILEQYGSLLDRQLDSSLGPKVTN